MMFSSFCALLLFSASVAAQSSSSATVVCIAGQCLEGFSNTTIGATITAPGISTPLRLLPGTYSSNSDPELLHNALTSSSASLNFSPGFSNTSNPSSFNLPLQIDLLPGLSFYSQSLFAGQASFVALPTANASNASVSLSADSLALSSNTWAAISSGSQTSRTIVWDTIPDVSQLPSPLSSGDLALLDLQSAACSPPCSSAGVCSASGTCVCPPGFTGSSCESCASGFFGSDCQACPAGCTSCDDGIAGSGRCLSQVVTNPPSSCNCLNGQCGANGQCECNAGWTASSNGTQCATCAPGFFLTSDGNCQVCALGCTECSDQTGNCVTCKSGFTQDANDHTQCNAPQSVTSSGAVCPDGSFSNGTACAVCSSSCQTCTAGTSNDCIICASGGYSLNGTCVGTNANGVCSGSTMIADNIKHECDACPAKCTSCGISQFSIASTVNQLQCTGCLPGFVLSNGQCVNNCPSGTFLSPTDNLTCTACDSTCGTCVGSSTFCLTCTNNQLASDGKCVSSCPSNTFSSSGSCIDCHPDCATCSGGSFTQCSSCPSSNPVLSSGRCLPTCSKNQFFDTTSSSCQNCDSSCSSCSASGPSSCLACANSGQVLQGGTCVPANCANSTSVVSGLGVCLSSLVLVPPTSGTSSSVPLPSISGLSDPTTVTVNQSSSSLAWWQILLMTLGVAFVVLMLLLCWRRRARKIRAKQTAAFAASKNLDKHGWKWKLIRFGEKLFGHEKSQRIPMHRMEMVGPEPAPRWKVAEDPMYHSREISAPFHPRHGTGSRMGSDRDSYSGSSDSDHGHNANHLSSVSMYSQITGLPRRGAEPRQLVKDRDFQPQDHRRDHTRHGRSRDGSGSGSRRGDPRSRFSVTTIDSSLYSNELKPVPPIPGARAGAHSRPPTPAEEYAMSVIDSNHGHVGDGGRSKYWLEPSASRNPFRP